MVMEDTSLEAYISRMLLTRVRLYKRTTNVPEIMANQIWDYFGEWMVAITCHPQEELSMPWYQHSVRHGYKKDCTGAIAEMIAAFNLGANFKSIKFEDTEQGQIRDAIDFWMDGKSFQVKAVQVKQMFVTLDSNVCAGKSKYIVLVDIDWGRVLVIKRSTLKAQFKKQKMNPSFNWERLENLRKLYYNDDLLNLYKRSNDEESKNPPILTLPSDNSMTQMNPATVYEKKKSGQKPFLTNKEVVEGAKFYHNLFTLLTQCGPVFKLSADEAYRTYWVLREIAIARNLIEDGKELI